MSQKPSSLPGAMLASAEAPAAHRSREFELWRHVHGEWRPLFGSVFREGISIEYHDFTTDKPLRWHESFHPDTLEVCLNWSGRGAIRNGSTELAIAPKTVASYFPEEGQLEAERTAGEPHCFVTVEMTREFLQGLFGDQADRLQPWLAAFLRGTVPRKHRMVAEPMPVALQRVFPAWSKPPVLRHAQSLWYQSRVYELAALLFYDPGQDGEMFCTRQQRLARERVEKIRMLLEADLLEPPSMEEVGRKIGCSPAYLSRVFSAETGTTIPQYLRQVRLDRAAALLRAGTHNVTEAALEVGYNSLSHFSKAFHETFGVCPGLYPQGAKLFAQSKPRDRRAA